MSSATNADRGVVLRSAPQAERAGPVTQARISGPNYSTSSAPTGPTSCYAIPAWQLRIRVPANANYSQPSKLQVRIIPGKSPMCLSALVAIQLNLTGACGGSIRLSEEQVNLGRSSRNSARIGESP